MIGDFRHPVQFQNPGASVPDGDGGFTQSWTAIAPVSMVSIEPIAVHDVERRTAGTVLSTGTHLIRGWFLAGVGITSRMVWDGRTFAITGLRNTDERGITMELLAVEKLGPA